MTKQNQLIPDGTPLRISDSKGIEIKMGDYIKRDVTGNNEIHGTWSIQKVKCQGPFPILSYVTSEKKKVFPADYSACFLSDMYDHKHTLFALDTRDISPPDDDLYVMDKDEAEAFIAAQENPYSEVED